MTERVTNMDIELELKIDEVIKRLERTKAYDNAYIDFCHNNDINNPKRELIYILFNYDVYTYHLCFRSRLFDYLHIPQVIILGAF